MLVQAGPYKQELPGKIVSIDYCRKEDLPEEMGDIGEILKKSKSKCSNKIRKISGET